MGRFSLPSRFSLGANALIFNTVWAKLEKRNFLYNFNYFFPKSGGGKCPLPLPSFDGCYCTKWGIIKKEMFHPLTHSQNMTSWEVSTTKHINSINLRYFTHPWQSRLFFCLLITSKFIYWQLHVSCILTFALFSKFIFTEWNRWPNLLNRFWLFSL